MHCTVVRGAPSGYVVEFGSNRRQGFFPSSEQLALGSELYLYFEGFSSGYAVFAAEAHYEVQTKYQNRTFIKPVADRYGGLEEPYSKPVTRARPDVAARYGKLVDSAVKLPAQSYVQESYEPIPRKLSMPESDASERQRSEQPRKLARVPRADVAERYGKLLSSGNKKQAQQSDYDHYEDAVRSPGRKLSALPESVAERSGRVAARQRPEIAERAETTQPKRKSSIPDVADRYGKLVDNSPSLLESLFSFCRPNGGR